MKDSVNALDTAQPLVAELMPPASHVFPTRPSERPVLKKFPHDFLVSESLVLPRRLNGNEAKFSYLKLTKSGFTTFEAVDKVAQHFQIPAEQVLFAGLKDEDAVTEQLLAVPLKISPSAIEGFNGAHVADRRGFMELQYCHAGDEPLVIGRLNGNSFRIVVRNLSQRFAECLRRQLRYTFQFLNYYDTQRFGVANQPKTSHLIGKALVEEDYGAALEILRHAGTPESQKARGFDGPPQDFFSGVSPRVINFLKDSYSSSLWNERLAGLVRQVCDGEVFEERADRVPFLFTWKQSLILSILKERPSIEFTKFHGPAGAGAGGTKLRATVVQTQVHCHGIGPDPAHPDAYFCDLSFFLPSGCYATMCLRQLVNTCDLTS